MARSIAAEPKVAALLRGVVKQNVGDRIVVAHIAPDASLRTTLAGSQVIGLVVDRYVLRVKPFADAAPDALVTAIHRRPSAT